MNSQPAGMTPGEGVARDLANKAFSDVAAALRRTIALCEGGQIIPVTLAGFMGALATGGGALAATLKLPEADARRVMSTLAANAERLSEAGNDYPTVLSAVLDEAFAEPRRTDPLLDRVAEVLRFYAQHGAGCRKVTSDGDAHRHALDKDGGELARALLSEIEARHG